MLVSTVMARETHMGAEGERGSVLVLSLEALRQKDCRKEESLERPLREVTEGAAGT